MKLSCTVPINFPRALIDLAFHLKWTPQTLDDLTVEQVLWWHTLLIQLLKTKPEPEGD